MTPFPFFLLFPCNSHLSSIYNFFVTILVRIFPRNFLYNSHFYFSRMPKYPEKSDKLFSVPLMRRVFLFIIPLPLFPPYGHIRLYLPLSYFIPIACHVNILFPCPACVSGYRIIWHAMIL